MKKKDSSPISADDAAAPENKRKSSGGVGGIYPPPVEDQFQPGESGNPGGRPKNKWITDEYKRQLKLVNPKDRQERTYLECMVAEMIHSAIKKSSVQATAEITDRVEGKLKAMEDADEGEKVAGMLIPTAMILSSEMGEMIELHKKLQKAKK